MNTTPSHDIPILRFCLLWVLAITIAATAVLLLADFLVWRAVEDATPEVAFSDDNAIGPILEFGLWMIVLLLPFVGFVQALVLWQVAHFTAWEGWGLRSSLLIPIYLLVALVPLVFLTFSLGGGCLIVGFVVLPGFAIGLAQSRLVPNLDIEPSSRLIWIAANTIALPLGAACGFLVTSITGASYFASATYRYPFYPLQSAMYWALGWVVGAVIFSALTGMVLAWLLSRQGNSSGAGLAT
jgi:hypothetical protein